MTDERRNVVESTETEPELELDFTVGDPRVTDAELERLRELARSGTVETVPDQPYAVNRINEMHGQPAVVVEDRQAGSASIRTSQPSPKRSSSASTTVGRTTESGRRFSPRWRACQPTNWASSRNCARRRGHSSRPSGAGKSTTRKASSRP
jgi:hypothetical protein